MLREDPIGNALAEDLGMGDLTSKYFVGDGEGQARIFAKESAVVAGLNTGAEVFRRVDAGLNVWVVGGDGDRVEFGQTVLEISGLVRSILTAERVALNFIQRLSGTAICEGGGGEWGEDFGHAKDDAGATEAGKSGGSGWGWSESSDGFV